MSNIKRLRSVLDISKILDIIGNDAGAQEILILKTKITLPSVFFLMDEDERFLNIYEFVSGDICILHTYKRKGEDIVSFMEFCRASNMHMINEGCRLFMGIKEMNRPEVGHLLAKGGGERVYQMKNNKVVYFKEVR